MSLRLKPHRSYGTSQILSTSSAGGKIAFRSCDGFNPFSIPELLAAPLRFQDRGIFGRPPSRRRATDQACDTTCSAAPFSERTRADRRSADHLSQATMLLRLQEPVDSGHLPRSLGCTLIKQLHRFLSNGARCRCGLCEVCHRGGQNSVPLRGGRHFACPLIHGAQRTARRDETYEPSRFAVAVPFRQARTAPLTTRSIAVTVGTPVRLTPHVQIPACALTHGAPTSGV